MNFDKFINYNNNEKMQFFEINIIANEFKKQNNYDKLLVHIVKLMQNIIEQSRNLYNKDYVYVNIDFIKFNVLSFDQNFATTFISLMQSLFPEKLKKCYVYNMDSLYSIIFNIILDCLDSRTKSKIEIVSKENNKKISLNI